MLAEMSPEMTLGVTTTTLGPVPWPFLLQQHQLEALRALLLVQKKNPPFTTEVPLGACFEGHDLWVSKQRTCLRKD